MIQYFFLLKYFDTSSLVLKDKFNKHLGLSKYSQHFSTTIKKPHNADLKLPSNQNNTVSQSVA